MKRKGWGRIVKQRARSKRLGARRWKEAYKKIKCSGLEGRRLGGASDQ